MDPSTTVSMAPSTTTIILTSSVVAAFISLASNFLLQYWARRSARIFSAIRIATTLEKFVQICVNELGTYDAFVSSKGMIGRDSVTLPRFPKYPDDIAWEPLPRDLVERALTLFNEVEYISRDSIKFMSRVDGPHEMVHAIEETVKRAKQALDLADKLRDKYNYPAYPDSAEIGRILNAPRK